MKKVFLTLMALLFIYSCGGGGGSGGSPPQNLPKITDVIICNEDWFAQYSFDIGEYANFIVYAEDPDLNMETLYVNLYLSESSIPYFGPVIYFLPDQSDVETSYYNSDPIEIIWPSGEYRLEFEIEDAKGNESNIFKVIIYVN